MPPRKSNVSAVSNGAEDGAETTPARPAKDGMSVEDLSLPKSMIARLAKGVLPANTQIQKDALLALHKSATVFVSYIASNSSELAQAGGKRTTAPQDVMAALKDAEFEEFLPRLDAELKKYNDMQCDKRNTYRRKVKEEKAGKEAAEAARDGEALPHEGEATEGINGTVNGHAELDVDERPAKKLKAENGVPVPPEADDLEDEEIDVEQGGEADDQPDEDEDEEDEEADDGEEDEGEEEGDGHAEGAGLDESMAMGDDVIRDEALDDPDDDSD